MTENDYLELRRIKNTLSRQSKIFEAKWESLSQDWNDFLAYVDTGSLNSDSAKLSEKSNLILSIQELLTELGYSPGATDGVMGQKTSSAIKAFQVTHDIEADGLASEKLLVALQVVLQSMRIPEDKNPNKQKEKLTSTGSGFYINNENVSVEHNKTCIFSHTHWQIGRVSGRRAPIPPLISSGGAIFFQTPHPP